MKISNTPTAHLLLRASSNSEWDCCDFAIVNLSKEWKQTQQKRLDAVEPFKGDISFQSLNFYDSSADFYQPDEDGILSSEDLPKDKDWCFVELTDAELEKLAPPENLLDCHTIVVYNNGEVRYKAYGKHTAEEFWTERFSLQQVVDLLPY